MPGMPLHPVHRRNGLGRRGDGPAGGREEIGHEAGLARICRRQRRGRRRRPHQALGGALHVPPTDVPNISRFSIAVDPQMATIALFEVAERPAKRSPPHWAHRAASAGTSCSPPTGRRRLPSTPSSSTGRKRAPTPVRSARTSCSPPEERRSAACSPSLRWMPVPFWLYYFNVGDIDAAAKRAEAGGGQILSGPTEVPAAAAGSSSARTRRAPSSRSRESGATTASDISSAPHRAIRPASRFGRLAEHESRNVAAFGLGREGRWIK